jgi:hypothetical protein
MAHLTALLSISDFVNSTFYAYLSLGVFGGIASDPNVERQREYKEEKEHFQLRDVEPDLRHS